MAQPIVRISKGRFAAEKYPQVRELIEDSAKPLVPALQNLRGLLYYHSAVDPMTSTVVNASVWEDTDAARQMDTLGEMLAQRTFDRPANYEALWKIEKPWGFEPGRRAVRS